MCIYIMNYKKTEYVKYVIANSKDVKTPYTDSLRGVYQ